MGMKKLIIILFVLILSQNVFAQSWQSTFFRNCDNIQTLVKRDSLNYFAFCYNSDTYMKSTDAGNTWISDKIFSFGGKYTIYSGQFVTNLIGWLVGYDYFTYQSIVLKTSNGGISWQLQNNLGLEYLIGFGISFSNEATGWITAGSGNFGKVLKTTNGGLNWLSQSMPFIGPIKFINSTTGWIAGRYGYIFKTTNAGDNWLVDTTFKSLYILDIAPVDANECWVLTQDGTPNDRIYKTTNSGINWQLVITNSSAYSKIYNLNNSSTFLVTGSEGNYIKLGVFLKTTDSGASWDTIRTNTIAYLNTLMPGTGNILFAGGGANYGEPTHNLIFKSTNLGNSWSRVHYNYPIHFNDIYFKNKEYGLIASDSGMVFRTTNSGINWVLIENNISNLIQFFKTNSENSLFAFCQNGKILKTTNFGDNWIETQVPSSFWMTSAQFINSETGFATSANSLMKTSDGGNTWFAINTQIPSDFQKRDVSFINTNTGFCLANKSTWYPGAGTVYFAKIIKTTDSGLTWTLVHDGGNMNSYISKINFTDEISGFAMDEHTIYKTTNGGNVWNAHVTNTRLNFLSIKMLNQNTGWCGGQNNYDGEIYKTTNGGNNWYFQLAANNKNFLSFFISDSNYVWVCGDKNTIYNTTDGGGKISGISTAYTGNKDSYFLSQNYPNPFNPSTVIRYQLSVAGFTTLKVFDLLGKEVASLVNEKQNAGSYAVDFNSSEFNLTSGIYFYTLNAGEFKETRKMVLVK